jgi:phosphatidylserine/phosphatidylglycerophosphate/cardiolipin synthase-like enzyme
MPFSRNSPLIPTLLPPEGGEGFVGAALLVAFLILAAPVQAATVETAFSPQQGATDLIVRTIGEAKQSVYVAAYFFTSTPIADALVAAHARGVDVKLVMDGHQRSLRVIDYLNRNGIATRRNNRYAIMHDKFIIVDGKTLETGSFNFTRAAEYENAENVLVVRDSPNVIGGYARQWNRLWDEAEAQN